MAKRTRYTPEFKAEVVLEALTGDSSQAQLCRRHNLSEQQLSKWNLSQHLTQALTLNPLEHALRDRGVEIHHSDQGVQSLSNDYFGSMALRFRWRTHRGRPWENGYAERLIRTLKEEEVHLNEYQNIHEARDRIEHFITHVYNLKRLHSALGYLTPMEFEQKNLS